MPYRIARGDLEGKMKCRIWKKLHAEEAKRFDQAFTTGGSTHDPLMIDGSLSLGQ